MTMTERKNIMLYLNPRIIKILKEKRVNISELINKYLENYVVPDISIAEVSIQADRLEAEGQRLLFEASSIRKEIELRKDRAEKLEAEAKARIEKMGGLLADKTIVARIKTVKEKPGFIDANIIAIENMTGIKLTKEEFWKLAEEIE